MQMYRKQLSSNGSKLKTKTMKHLFMILKRTIYYVSDSFEMI